MFLFEERKNAKNMNMHNFERAVIIN